MLGFPSSDAIASTTPPRWGRRRHTPSYARRGMVASAHPLATAAGLRVLANGGNAVDAAIATALACSVVLPAACGIGGDLFAIVADARDGSSAKPLAFVGSGIAPRNTTIDFMREHGDDGGRVLAQQGPLSPSVPGLVDAVFSMLDRLGTRSFGELAADAIDYAGNGFPISVPGATAIANNAELLGRFPASAAVFLPGGRPPAPGSLFRQRDLAASIRLIADGGRDVFYRGELAKRIGDYLTANGGVLAADDFVDHETIIGPPLGTTYRGYNVYQTGLPTQGFLLLEALNIVEHDDVAKLGVDRAAGVHQLAEAMKLAFADRLRYTGDPRFVDNPLATLISKPWATRRHAAIDPDRAAEDVPAGDLRAGDTTYLCTMDGDGMMVSLILSVSAGFGSGVIAGDTGILLNNRAGHCFSLVEGHPNVFEPGKKTMHTLNCYLISAPDGTPVLVGGTPGGDSQPQWNLQTIGALVDGNLDVQAAAEMPRWSVWPGTYPIEVDNRPFELRIEDRYGEETLSDLAARGHRVVPGGPWTQGGAVQLIARDPETGALAGGSDPRGEGMALGL
ncbi:MAG: gamma-glutamyltranspeptidase / glutathione hydrolase [Thermomicrobiales bacterium]|nr:gamma-glutamyltranspeptidase / glutathione hydrolase [Thermomicrobiales bacterium]